MGVVGVYYGAISRWKLLKTKYNMVLYYIQANFWTAGPILML